MNPNSRSSCATLLQLPYFEKIRTSPSKWSSVQMETPEEVSNRRPSFNDASTSLICLDGLSIQNPKKTVPQPTSLQANPAEQQSQNGPTHHGFARADQRKIVGSTCSLTSKGTSVKLQPAVFPWLSGSCSQLNRRAGSGSSHTPTSTKTGMLQSDPHLGQASSTRYQGSTPTNQIASTRNHLVPLWPATRRAPSAVGIGTYKESDEGLKIAK
ncbi:hypothetical protein ACTXT7_006123 [Hymenolepis weldensis]